MIPLFEGAFRDTSCFRLWPFRKALAKEWEGMKNVALLENAGMGG